MFRKKPKFIQPGKYEYGLKVNFVKEPLEKLIREGDVFCVGANTLLAKTICFFSKQFSSDRKAEYNHGGVIVDGPCTLESLWTLRTHNLFYHYEGKRVLISRWHRHNHIYHKVAMEKLTKHIGQVYPFHRLFFHMLNLAHIFHWNRLVCTEFVAKYLYRIGARHGKFFGTTPDMLVDEFKNYYDGRSKSPKYEIINEGRLPFLIYKYCPKCRTFSLIPNEQSLCEDCNHILHIKITDQYLRSMPVVKEILTYNRNKLNWIGYMEYNQKVRT